MGLSPKKIAYAKKGKAGLLIQNNQFLPIG